MLTLLHGCLLGDLIKNNEFERQGGEGFVNGEKEIDKWFGNQENPSYLYSYSN